MHYRHRDYRPESGRFIQQDPLGDRIRVIWINSPKFVGVSGPDTGDDYNQPIRVFSRNIDLQKTYPLHAEDNRHPLDGNRESLTSMHQYSEGLNIYAYCTSNPQQAIDPYGLSSQRTLPCGCKKWPCEHFPDPWENPDDIVCNKLAPSLRPACKTAYKVIKCNPDRRTVACQFASNSCIVNCGTEGRYKEKAQWGILCNNLCKAKEAECIAKGW